MKKYNRSLLIKKGAKKHLIFGSLKKYMPSTDRAKLSEWRKSLSDHFPLYFDYKVMSSDVDADWK